MGKKLINTNSHKSFLEVFNHKKHARSDSIWRTGTNLFCEFQKVGWRGSREMSYYKWFCDPLALFREFLYFWVRSVKESFVFMCILSLIQRPQKLSWKTKADAAWRWIKTMGEIRKELLERSHGVESFQNVDMALSFFACLLVFIQICHFQSFSFPQLGFSYHQRNLFFKKMGPASKYLTSIGIF